MAQSKDVISKAERAENILEKLRYSMDEIIALGRQAGLGNVQC